MQNSPTAAYLRECSLHERIMLAALLKVIKREGVGEVRWGDVSNQATPSISEVVYTTNNFAGPVSASDIHGRPHRRRRTNTEAYSPRIRYGTRVTYRLSGDVN